MSKLFIPKDYKPLLDPTETQRAIKRIKDHFQRELAHGLNLGRVSAPLFVIPQTGLNDNLNGYERRVEFTIKDMNEQNVEVVQSLAKWKRMALGRYGVEPGRGLYTDMNAIRRDEELDNIHSIYVDQWDWEKVITADQRTNEYLEQTVRNIYRCLRDLADYVDDLYPDIKNDLPDMITFIGEYSAKIDDKGRVVFPSPFKSLIPAEGDARFVVKKDIFEDCLEMYTFEEWERQSEEVKSKLNFFNRAHAAFWREYMRNRAIVEPDAKLGRISIPKKLLESIGVTKEVVFSGNDYKIEIWAKERYEASEISNEEFLNIAGQLSQQR